MTPLQSLLLRAAHGPDDEARVAWAGWRKTAVWDEIDSDSHYLLPALYRTLARLEIDDEWRPRLAGIHRKAWCANQLLRQATAPAMRVLTDAGVPLMLLPAPALVYAYQPDCGLRPLDKLHCLIRREHLPTAQRLLPESGWSALKPRYHRMRRLLKGPASSFAFAADSMLPRLVICWRWPGLPAATDFWTHAGEIPWEQTRLKVVAPSDALQILGNPAGDYGGLWAESDSLAIKTLCN